MKFVYDIDKVMMYFYEISKIPRMSGKEEKIANYIEDFAKSRNLKYIRDIYNNIIVIKEASKWNKSKESIMLQGHLDMVCEKEENYCHNFEEDGLDLYIDGDFIKAKGTTLGADNGIGVAMILSILDSKELNHPRIEAIFTVEEESTMNGAKTIDVSTLESKKMICLDNMNEDELWIGCASAKIFEYEIKGNITKIPPEYISVKVGLNGFVGGHSGKDISKDRGNPIEEMGILLKDISEKYDIFLKRITGGRKVNVIPRECYCEIYIKNEHFNEIQKMIANFNKELIKKIKNDNENIKAFVEEIRDSEQISFDGETTKRLIDILNNIPNGVYYKDKNENPLVSLNIGKVESKYSNLKISFSIRSNRFEIEKKLIEKLQIMVREYDINDNISELSGYEHKERSEFIDKCKKMYNDYFERKPKVIDMHICLEAGFFGEKIKDLDFIAIAPNIYDPHSPNERCSISSLKKVYNYVLLLLGNM